MDSSYYHRRHLAAFGTIAEGNAQLAEKFFDYYGAVFADGALTVREKSLIALAVAHAVQCPYCIDAYTSGSLEAGADLEQMTEAVHVAVHAHGGAVADFAEQMLSLAGAASMGASGKSHEAYFSRERITPRLGEEARAITSKLEAYEQAVMQEGALSVEEKLLIALAVAHVAQNPYGIEALTQRCLQRDLTLAQMTEAVHVACAIRGGAALVHGIQMLERVKGS